MKAYEDLTYLEKILYIRMYEEALTDENPYIRLEAQKSRGYINHEALDDKIKESK